MSGVVTQVTNAQQLVERTMDRKCVCLRSREVRETHAPDAAEAILCEHRYHAAGGEEVFLSFESADRRWVYGFVKLRMNWCHGSGMPDDEKLYLPQELQGRTAVIRWLQVYGRAVGIGQESAAAEGTDGKGGGQHRGLGLRLMAAAEDIARDRGATRLADISGIGEPRLSP
jgi:elongator complex protein 3